MPDFLPQEIKQSTVASSDGKVSVMEKSFYQSNKYYIWAVAAASVVIAVLAYFAFRSAPAVRPKEANVSLEIQAPETLPSGSEAVYRIQVRNNDSVKLTELELELAYPESFTYVSSVPNAENISGSAFKISSGLLPGQDVSVIVKAKTSGDINSEKRLLAKLHYKYSNFNSSFAKEASHALRLTASNAYLEIEGPKETNSAQVVAYSVTYKNNSKDVIKNARVKLGYPIGFNYGSSQPSASLGGNIWNIGDLQSGSEGKITFQGTFAGSNSGEEKTITAELQALGLNGEYFVQNTALARTTIISQPLLVSVENLDQRNSNAAQPGETLDFSMRYENNSSIAATGVNIAITLDSKALDLASIRAQGAQVVGNTISWNAAGVPLLESLNPSESGSLNFSVRVNNPAVKDSAKNLKIVISAKIKANEYSTFLPGGGIELKIASPARIETELSYVNGSLPPQVGTQTKYRARIKLINGSNDFSGGEFTAFLPSASGTLDLSSVNGAERDNVQFDPSTGKLTWEVGILPAYSGKFSPAKILEFELTANPSPSDAGDRLLLIRNIRFLAKDNFTEKEVDINSEDITTASLAGQNGYANGIVVP